MQDILSVFCHHISVVSAVPYGCPVKSLLVHSIRDVIFLIPKDRSINCLNTIGSSSGDVACFSSLFLTSYLRYACFITTHCFLCTRFLLSGGHTLLIMEWHLCHIKDSLKPTTAYEHICRCSKI